MRQDYTICAAIERIEDLVVACRLRANKNCLAPSARRQNAQIERRAVKRGVLGIKHKAVKAGEAQYLDHMWVRGLDPSASEQITCTQLVAKAYHSLLLAISAPSANVFSLAQTISGSTTPKPAKVEKPQSVPAITRSRPIILA